MNFDEFEIVHSYTRKMAIEDGVLVDVSDTAREVGIRFPVAVTAAVWHLIEPTEKLKELGQDIGRLFDTLNMFRHYALKCEGDTLFFDVLFLNANGKHDKVTFKAVIGAGDTPEPVITIMLPEED